MRITITDDDGTVLEQVYVTRDDDMREPTLGIVLGSLENSLCVFASKQERDEFWNNANSR